MESKKEISTVTNITQAAGLVAADKDGKKVMLNIDKGTYYGLDDIGSHIWDLLEVPRKIQEVVDLLLQEYDVEEKVCQHDVMLFINKLYDRGLVDID
ncbi:MAG: lasso peptide biosynthesis PqqD family chaperone [Eubacteriales bacterium]|jgi:hypothetical protein